MTDHAMENSRAWSVSKRVLAAVFLGYILANTVGTAISLALPVSTISGVVVGTLSTFVIWACAILWVFAEPSMKKVMIGLTVAIAISTATAALLFLLTEGQ